MGIGELRKALEEIRLRAAEGDLQQVVSAADSALQVLDGGRLLTTTEAAELLGIRSVNTLKLLVRRLGLRYELHGNRMMIPLAELEAVQSSAEVRGIRASDRAHDESEALGSPHGLSVEQLRDLAASRPGVLPWKASGKRSDSRAVQ